jgi:hypothetical protein
MFLPGRESELAVIVPNLIMQFGVQVGTKKLDSMKILTTYMGETTGSKFDRDKDYPD